MPHRLPPPSTLEIIIPANAVGKVMGKGGANIANIRTVSDYVCDITMLLCDFIPFFTSLLVTL